MIKRPVNVKLKDMPLGYRLLMRLVTLEAQRVRTINLPTLCEMEGVQLSEGVAALDLAVSAGQLTMEPAQGLAFTFKIEKAVAEQLCQDAASYKRHLEARIGKLPPLPSKKPPPIDPDERVKHLAAGNKLAAQLLKQEKAHAAWALAGCIARLGLPAVKELVVETCAAKVKVQSGAFRHFFELYCARRDKV